MRLGVGMKLEISQPIDESNALKISIKRLSRPPEENIELMGVVGVTQSALCDESNKIINRAIPDVR
jgi:hypothetical protein